MAFIEVKEYKTRRSYIVRWNAPPDAKHKTRRRAKSFTRRKDAVVFKAEIEASLAYGTYVDLNAGEIKIGRLAEGYLAAKKGVVTAKYYESIESTWRVHVAPAFAQCPINRLKHSAVQSFVSELSIERSATIVNRALDILRGICNLAIKDNLIKNNPCEGIQKPKKQTTRMEDRHYLTPEQLQRLADCSGIWKPLVLTLGLCGLRYGEARALQVKNLDFKRHRIRVERSITRAHREWVVSDTKTHQRRDVPMPKIVEDALLELVKNREPDDLVFCRPDGKYIDEQTAKRPVKNLEGKYWWRCALTSAGLPPMRIHDLRHTAASIAISSGAKVLQVQRMLGHKNAAMTLNTYADLFDEDMDEVSQHIDNIFMNSI